LSDFSEGVSRFIAESESPEHSLRALKERLSELLSGVDAIELFSRVSIYYLPRSLDSVLEGEGEALQVHTEYLALQVLGLMKTDTDNLGSKLKPDWSTTYEVIPYAGGFFDVRSKY